MNAKKRGFWGENGLKFMWVEHANIEGKTSTVFKAKLVDCPECHGAHKFC